VVAQKEGMHPKHWTTACAICYALLVVGMKWVQEEKGNVVFVPGSLSCDVAGR
jgi:hypothetical protein